MITFRLHGTGDGPQRVARLNHNYCCLRSDGDRIGRSIGLATKRKQAKDHSKGEREDHKTTPVIDGWIEGPDTDRGLIHGEPVGGDGGLEGVG